MPKPIYLLSVSLLVCCGFVQQHPIVAFRLERGQRLDQVAWRDSVYLFSSFREGSLSFGKQGGQNLRSLYNYNVFLDRVEVISEKGDTIPIRKGSNIEVITIGDAIFFNHKQRSFIEIKQIGRLNLGIRHFVKVFMESGTGERFAVADDGIRERAAKYDRVYVKEKAYYLVDSNFTLHPTTLQQFNRFLQPHEEEITQFFKSKKLDLRKEDDLFLLLNFCQTLK